MQSYNLVTYLALATYLFQCVITTTRRGQEELISDPCDHFLYSLRLLVSQEQQVNHMFAIKYISICMSLILVGNFRAWTWLCTLDGVTRTQQFFFSVVTVRRRSLLFFPVPLTWGHLILSYSSLSLSSLSLTCSETWQKKRVCSTADS